jgi:hypothetical protein
MVDDPKEMCIIAKKRESHRVAARIIFSSPHAGMKEERRGESASSHEDAASNIAGFSTYTMVAAGYRYR